MNQSILRAREREVLRLIAEGFTHKGVAVRNLEPTYVEREIQA